MNTTIRLPHAFGPASFQAIQNPIRSSRFPCLVARLAYFAMVACIATHAADSLVIADFEGDDYGDWKVTGTAFGPAPARGTLPNQMAVDGFLGKGLVNSFYQGDDSLGTLTSPPFKIQRRYLRFLIGGGGWEGKTCMNLRVNGNNVRTGTGPNTQPGGSERLDWQQWDVQDLAGEAAAIEIVDQATGGWGHINVDQIIQTDERMPGWVTNVQRAIQVEKRYLNLPVKNGAPKRLLTLLVGDRPVRQFEIELAESAPDWWAILDLGAFKGQPAVIQVDKLKEGSSALNQIEQGDELRDAADLYQEKLRPQFHFSSRRGWNNDPNGLVYYDQEYHLFYQHNPYGWNWGNMHWGHAVSTDLVHWRELGEAIYPDALGTAFSGSAVVDWPNTAGFAHGDERPIVCIYTAAGDTSAESKGVKFSQCLAYSLDRGRTWAKYAGNPVVPHIVGGNRDPKVIWYAPEKKWIMALFLDGSDYALLSSKDLKQWERMSTVSIPGTSECPEFFEIAVGGDQRNTRWVFYGGNGRYLVGRFDGTRFTQESGPQALNAGNCFYASQTYTQIPAADGRRILVPWGTMATPGMPFNQMMGLPVELTLAATDEGLRLFAYPVREFEMLRTAIHTLKSGALKPGENPLSEIQGELLDIEAEIGTGEAEEVGFVLRGIAVSYDTKKQELTCHNHKAAFKSSAGKIKLRLLVDRTSIDVFGNDGQLYMPMGVVVPANNRSLELHARGGAASVESLVVHELKSAWKP